MTDVQEVYSNRLGSIYQNDSRNCYVLAYNGRATLLSVGCFFHLKKQFDQVDIDAMVNNPRAEADMVILAPHACDRVFVLTLSELLQIKELFAGARVMLELNSILQERVNASVPS